MKPGQHATRLILERAEVGTFLITSPPRAIKQDHGYTYIKVEEGWRATSGYVPARLSKNVARTLVQLDVIWSLS